MSLFSPGIHMPPDPGPQARGRVTLGFLVASVLVFGSGCAGSFQRIDARLAVSAQRAVSRDRSNSRRDRYRDEERYDEEDEGSGGSIFLGELLAIFPGLFVHGLGHTYAGDHQSARKLREMGEWGYLLTAVGGGIVVGAYFLDREADDALGTDVIPISLYVAGGGIGGVGLAYFFTAWIADIWDTPRAVRSGGEPWPWLRDSMDDDFDPF